MLIIIILLVILLREVRIVKPLQPSPNPIQLVDEYSERELTGIRAKDTM